MKSTYVEVGSVRKTHGFAGEVKLIVYEGFEDDVEDSDFLFIGAQADRAIPYEILELRGADWIVKLDSVDTKEVAAALRGQHIYLPAQDITSVQHLEQEAQVEHYRRTIGFSMHDLQLGLLGTINDIVSYPQQTLAALDYNEKEVLVPLNQHFVKDIDFNKSVVVVELPEGLLDL